MLLGQRYGRECKSLQRIYKQYFFISSCAVYNTRLGEVCHEDSPKVLPVWSYSVNKWASEQHLMKLLEGSDVHYTIIRPCVTYGNTRTHTEFRLYMVIIGHLLLVFLPENQLYVGTVE